ncbi:hypothetical protein BGW41_006426, partial [Actinomortierella wolfii]
MSEDGKTIISFGGLYVGTGSYMSGVALLDVETGIWRNGTYVGDFSRQAQACTVSGDYFLIPSHDDILWQGCDTSTPVYIYQISKDAWVEKYQPPTNLLKPDPSTVPISSTTSTPSSTPSMESIHSPTNGPNIGVITGGAVGAVVVVVAILLFVWRRRKMTPKSAVKNNGSAVEDDHHNPTLDDKYNGHKHDTGRIHHRMAPDNSTLQSPQVTYRHEYDGGDGQNDHDDDLYDGKRQSPKAAVAPHYPSWGANFNESYATDGFLNGYNQAIDSNNANRTRLQSTLKRYPSPQPHLYDHVAPPPPPPHSTSPPT